MDDHKYIQILAFLRYGRIPQKPDISSRSNFRSTANKYAVNGGGKLIRNGKEVVKKSMQGKKFFFSFFFFCFSSLSWLFPNILFYLRKNFPHLP